MSRRQLLKNSKCWIILAVTFDISLCGFVLYCGNLKEKILSHCRSETEEGSGYERAFISSSY
jgi:hypothetical protein